MVVKRSHTEDATAALENEAVNESSDDDDTVVSDSDNAMPEDAEEKVEPTPKKLKRDVTKEAEDDLVNYDAIVKDPDVKFTEKLSKGTFYLGSVFENNVNTLEFATNFNDWVKKVLLLLLEEGTAASEGFYEFLCKVLKVAPTIIEPTCEKVLTFIFTYHQFSIESNAAFENFMENLSYTFEKLRRFPKLIAKFLCCIRDNINGMDKRLGPHAAHKFMKKMLGYKSKDDAIFVLPKRFIESYDSVIGMLSAGQIIDLWKTLHHNLEEECIKKYSSSDAIPTTCFLSVVGELTVSFLCNIKVADYSVPISTVERVVDMMDKLKQNIISELAANIPEEYDSVYTRSFLKLCNAWSHLHHFMCIYNENYSSTLANDTDNFQQAVDLSFLFPQLSSEDWLSLWIKIEKNKDDISASLMVSVVALKLKLLAVLHQNKNTITENHCNLDDAIQRNIQETAKFLWNHQTALIKLEQNSTFVSSCADTLKIATPFLQQDELIEYAKTLLDNTLTSAQPVSDHLSIQSFQQQLSSNMKFRVALLLESLHECVKRIGKGSSLKRPVKRFLSECFSPSCKMKILKSLELSTKVNTLDEELKKAMMEAVQIVNNVMTLECNMDSEEQISVTLLKEIVSLVCNEELTQYPKTVKTLIFLSFALVFTALIKYCKDSPEITDEITTILSECGRHSQGNDILFHIHWPELFGIVKANADLISEKAMGSLCHLILESIYISPKVANDFGDQYIKIIGDEDGSINLSSIQGHLAVCVLDYILGEVIAGKSKSISVLTAHAKELCGAVVSKLSDGSIITDLHDSIHSIKKNKRKSLTTAKKSKLPNNFVSRILRSCYLLLKGQSFMSPEDKAEVTVIILPYLQFAAEYLEYKSKAIQPQEDNVGFVSIPEIHNCIQFLLEALKTFQEHREKLPQSFLLQVWNSSCALDYNSKDEAGKMATLGFSRLILEVADETEFQSICDSVVERMDNNTELIRAARILNSFISAETSNEKKKQIRRSTIELGMYKYLAHIHLWNESDNFVQLAVPYIQFQTSLLKRRKPMGNLSMLSTCMSSITSFPLNKVESVESYKLIFSLICDLLNAMNVHRLDVLSFRSHVLVQCFQFLVESLVKRADQKNKLTDTEIYYLRHCAHSIERVCQSAKLGRVELARVSPYLVVVLLRQFERTTVYPIVKNPLLNGCYKLLDMCDDHGVSHVNSMLSTGSREIFKTVYELYKKFYRYKGKV